MYKIHEKSFQIPNAYNVLKGGEVLYYHGKFIKLSTNVDIHNKKYVYDLEFKLKNGEILTFECDVDYCHNGKCYIFSVIYDSVRKDWLFYKFIYNTTNKYLICKREDISEPVY